MNRVLDGDQFTAGEKWVVRWQYSLFGDFNKALANAIIRADERNLIRLRKGFPDEVDGFLAWNRGDLAPRLREAGLDL